MRAEEILETFPKLIVELENKVSAARKLLDLAKAEEEIAEATAMLTYQEEKNQALIKARVTLDPNVKEKRKERIEAHDGFLAATALYNQANNARDAAKKFFDQGMLNAEIEILIPSLS